MAKKVYHGALARSFGAAYTKYYEWAVKERSEYYEGLEKHYREFRRDSLVRSCVVTNAFYATSKGFETVLEVADPGGLSEEQIATELEEYRHVKDEIDALNKIVNMDRVLFIAQLKRSVYGSAGFEIVLDRNKVPEKLISLESEELKPDVSEDWNLTGYTYRGKKGAYDPDSVLYFVNLSFDGFNGISDVEPVLDIIKTRRTIIEKDLPETAEKLWSPPLILTVDVEGLSDEDADKAVTDIIANVEPGKSIALSQKVTATPIEVKPDIPGLVQSLEYCDLEIMGNFKTPRFLLNREKQLNRATSEKEFEAYINGVIAEIQRYFKREVERQWYDRQVHRILGIDDGDPLPIRVKHVWNPITVEDFYEMADAVSKLWGVQGGGPLGGRLDKVWDLMHWDKKELK